MPKNEGLTYNKGRAFVEFSTIDEANNVLTKNYLKALSANKTKLKNRVLEVTIGVNNAATNSNIVKRRL